ncbi:hypothetical protein G6M89_03175 [Natronolimnobius sp. AArcel1]|uniref:hypothetical protein n=1 Tax=Natronolimnobius sp. AArcel1 TaxID=1679093 RepID=UPI0013EC7C4F|nr:hypothetical protein [Natronolimnobius sp. AArcel1]NGM68023.1 hypothetical protein [Natronolimnobius sp. AArcel1]
MQATITGEDDIAVGLSVIDNAGTEHLIEMEHDGDIYHHQQDGYPDDPAQRTDEQGERVLQARKFARYYVFVEEGYDTVPAPENPVRIDAVRQAITEMDLAEFEKHFGDLYQQFDYEDGTGTRPAMTHPSEATDPTIYSKNVYLGVDPLETDLGTELARKHNLDVTKDAAEIDLTDVSGRELDAWGEFAGEFTVRAIDEDVDLSDAAYIDDTSELYVKYPSGGHLVAADDHLAPAAREPDTVLELLPIDPQDLEYFKSFMDHYLRCQIRDTFVEMGVHPPEEFRVLGMGRFMAARGYDYVDFYPEFHNPNARAFQQ